MNIHLVPGRQCRQRGVALPVMMIVLLIMLISGAYLLKSSNSATLTTANLAYRSSLEKANDRGLMAASDWLSAAWTANRASLYDSNAAAGYVANFVPGQTVNSSQFWLGKTTIAAPDGNTIEYVIHRMCSSTGDWAVSTNQCMQTTANTYSLGTSLALGSSMSSNTVQLAGAPQLHYIITARIFGARGGNVVSQMALLLGP